MLLLLIWPSAHDLCPNNEVMMFQPWTGTSTDVGSVAIVNLLLVSPTPPVSTVLWIFFPPPGTQSYRPPICYRSTPLHFCILHPLLPPHLSGVRSVRPPGRCPHPMDSTAHPCAYIHCRSRPVSQVPHVPWSPAPRAFGCLVSHKFSPPFPPLACAQVSVRP